MVSNLLNTSASKQANAFSKSSRFPSLPTTTSKVSHHTYTKLSDFDKTVLKARSKERHAFGARHDRFTYCPDARRDGLVSPISYRLKDAFEPSATFNTSSRYSFGTSRDRMVKLFVDEVVGKDSKGNASPSPGNYEPSKTFGKSGIHSTISPRRDRTGLRSDRYDPRHFRGEKNLPGPGSYQAAEVVGNTKMVSSLTPSQPKFGFSKAENRFRAPTEQFKSPSPSQYRPQAEIGIDVSSKMTKVPRTKFGNDRSDVLDMKFNMKSARTQPGPGQYERYSEFQPK